MITVAALVGVNLAVFVGAVWAGLRLGSPALVLGAAGSFAGGCGYMLLAGPAGVVSLLVATVALVWAMVASMREDRAAVAELDAQCLRLERLLEQTGHEPGGHA